MKRILCYGDSNTWGYNPENKHRFPEEVRWTGVAAKCLGDDYRILESGIVGRTTMVDDETHACCNGMEGLGFALISQRPLDLVVLMLGSNDLKFISVEQSASYCEGIIEAIKDCERRYHCSSPIFPNGQPKVLLLSPIRVNEKVPGHPKFEQKSEESLLFARYLSAVAERQETDYLDASLYAEPSDIDGLHMTADSHRRLGVAVAEKIKSIL
ncbi:MAG: hypothetical protein IJZ85_11640 [Lachnospiraceae bacterium]|nr:hypothetical protein [Lachnospiraceae bacterium]